LKDMQKLENIKQLIFQKQEVFNKRLESLGQEKDEKRLVIQQKLAYLKEKFELIEAKEEATKQKLLSIEAKLNEMREKRESLLLKPRGLPVFRRSKHFDDKIEHMSEVLEGLESVSENISDEAIKQNDFETAFEVLWNGLIEHESPYLIREGIKNAKEAGRGFWNIHFSSPDIVIETWKLGKALPMKYDIINQDMDPLHDQTDFNELLKNFNEEQSVCVIMEVDMPNGIEACRWEVIHLQVEEE